MYRKSWKVCCECVCMCLGRKYTITYFMINCIYIKNQNEGIILRSTGCPFDNFFISKPMWLGHCSSESLVWPLWAMPAMAHFPLVFLLGPLKLLLCSLSLTWYIQWLQWEVRFRMDHLSWGATSGNILENEANVFSCLYLLL